ncbi:MAG: HAMP domain-containing protein [Candidatus Marinimicrobia bacterium]|nr:HAMP domain-containing protein [Candidatus Neomarinimicrobiota bacterium]
MRLKTKYIIFIILLHSIFFILSLQLLVQHRWWFLLTEILILISIAVSVALYWSLIHPVNLITAGVETLKDRDFNTRFVKVGQVEMDQLIEVYNQMIDQLRAERVRQREQHFFLERLIEASPMGIIVLDFDDRITQLNPAAVKAISVSAEQCIGFNLVDVGDSELAAVLSQLTPGEARIVPINGILAYKCRKSQFRNQGFYHHFIMIEELTDELYKSEKRAYGKIIRLMSHEINNSVGAVNSVLDSFLAYKRYLPAEDQTDFEHAIDVVVTRNRHLNRFMTNYAEVVRLPKPNCEKHDLHHLLQTVETLMQVQCSRKNIDWLWQLASIPFEVIIDVQQFEHVLVNLVKNAVDAITFDGTITVITTTEPVKTLIIRDTGGGFTPEVRKQLFTPFFSTKKNGQGIGLTLVREILMNHGFRFALERPATDYTDFIIYFD